jgi:hypothetical protein
MDDYRLHYCMYGYALGWGCPLYPLRDASSGKWVHLSSKRFFKALARIFHKIAQISCKSLIEWKVQGIHSVKTTRGLLRLYSSPQQLCFPPVAGHTRRADFEGGAFSSDFGALLLRGVDRQIGLTERLTAAIRDQRHPSSIDHPLRDL